MIEIIAMYILTRFIDKSKAMCWKQVYSDIEIIKLIRHREPCISTLRKGGVFCFKSAMNELDNNEKNTVPENLVQGPTDDKNDQ